MSAWISRGLALLAGLTVAGCGAADVTGVPTTSRAGAVTVTVPEGWQRDFSFRLADPAGEGISVVAGGSERLKAYVSTTALAQKLGDDPAKRDVYTFRAIVAAASGLARMSMGDGCEQDSVRPVAGAGMYGNAVTFRSCAGRWPIEVRAVLVDAGRTTVAWVTARDRSPERAQRVVQSRDRPPDRGSRRRPGARGEGCGPHRLTGVVHAREGELT